MVALDSIPTKDTAVRTPMRYDLGRTQVQRLIPQPTTPTSARFVACKRTSELRCGDAMKRLQTFVVGSMRCAPAPVR
jgi:hypothetical protein